MAKAHTSHAPEVAERNLSVAPRRNLSFGALANLSLSINLSFGIMVRRVGRKPDYGSEIIFVKNAQGRRPCEGIVLGYLSVSPYIYRRTCYTPKQLNPVNFPSCNIMMSILYPLDSSKYAEIKLRIKIEINIYLVIHA